MDRRRFLKVAGMGLMGLAVAPFVKLPKTEDTPPPKEQLINLVPPNRLTFVSYGAPGPVDARVFNCRGTVVREYYSDGRVWELPL